MFNILIVEDDLNLNRLLVRNLSDRGFSVTSVFNGKQALSHFNSHKPDLLITDIMMPEMDGITLVGNIKKEHKHIALPIIMLTALNAIEDKKNSFELGADDYITKPVNFDELVLRINALLRRYRLVTLKDISHNEIALNYASKSLYVFGKTIELTRKEFFILYMLLSSPERIYSRAQILDEVWGYDSESFERTVDVHINRLREKLHGKSVDIVTVRGLGYKAVLK